MEVNLDKLGGAMRDYNQFLRKLIYIYIHKHVIFTFTFNISIR